MKRYLLALCILGMYENSIAQNTNPWPSSGNVGIGTENPQYTLDVSGTIRATTKFLIPSGMYGFEVDSPSGLYMYTNELNSKSGDVYLAYRGTKAVNIGGGAVYLNGTANQNSYFNSGGNVGIGTATPSYNLDVTGTIRATSKFLIPSNMYGLEVEGAAGLYLYNNELNSKSGDVYLGYRGNKSVNIGGGAIYLNGSDNQNSYFNSGGNVGIGTATPAEKLSVNGKIRAREIKVEVINWPDYVFKEGYRLKGLEELEKFIKVNKHLPEIPPTTEVEKDGVDLGEISAKMLKKIEELTLYIIELKKENETQQKEINQLKSKY